MSLKINNVNAVDFLINSTPVERGYLNGALFWERKLDIWLSSFLQGSQSTWYGYFDIDAQVQSRYPGFKGDLIFHVDCPVVSTNVEYPLDAGVNAAARGYRTFTIRVETNSRIYGFGGFGGAGGTSTINGGKDKPSYPTPGDGKCHDDQLNRGGGGGKMGGAGGGCINGRGVAVLYLPNAWRNYLLAGGGGGGGSGRLNSNHVAGGGGGGMGFNNPVGGGGGNAGEAGSSSSFGKGGRGNEGPNNYGAPDPQPQIGGWGGNSVNWGENGWAPSNGGNGGTWNQSGGGGGMSIQLWTNWGNADHYCGRNGFTVSSPIERAQSPGPGSSGSAHDYRRPWADGGWGGRSGQPVHLARAIYYY